MKLKVVITIILLVAGHAIFARQWTKKLMLKRVDDGKIIKVKEEGR